jgi:hypothetical protein
MAVVVGRRRRGAVSARKIRVFSLVEPPGASRIDPTIYTTLRALGGGG